ncbi:amidohydrolase family protein [Streptomyces sp. NPDC087844]|uniref:amidohydrolase family protein n=1 Tax=Streptomyces sp. NPDC087844 TaxID=3365805 RepID=UPI0037FEB5CD
MTGRTDAVDAHHHVWDLSVRDQDWLVGPELTSLRRNFTAEELGPQARAAGVARTVLVQTITVAEETPEFLALADSSELIGAVVGWTDLTRPDVADELARLRGLPGGRHLRGIRHQVQGEPDPEWLLREDVRRGLAAVAEAGLAYDLVVLPHQLPACARAAERHPGLTFVLDHVGKPSIGTGELEPWATGVRALAALPNTVCKLSGMVTEADPRGRPVGDLVDDLAPYGDTVLEAFGPGRLMFGSDWPVCTLVATYAEVVDIAARLTGKLGESEREEIFSGTATRVYGL